LAIAVGISLGVLSSHETYAQGKKETGGAAPPSEAKSSQEGAGAKIRKSLDSALVGIKTGLAWCGKVLKSAWTGIRACRIWYWLEVALCLAACVVLLVSWRVVRAKCGALEKEIEGWEGERQEDARSSPIVVQARPQWQTHRSNIPRGASQGVAKAAAARGLPEALDATVKQLHRVEKLIEDQRARLFEQMRELAVEHQNAILGDYGSRYEVRLHEIERRYEDHCASLTAQHDAYCATLKDKCQHLSGALGNVEKDLGACTSERDSLQQRYDGRTAERDSLQHLYDGKVAELDGVLAALHPELYQGFLDLLAALPADAVTQYTLEAAAQYFRPATAEFRVLLSLCLTLRSLSDRLQGADDTSAAKLKLDLRELFRNFLDPHLSTFQSDPGVLAGLRERLATLLNDHVFSTYYRCRWPRIGETYNQGHHQLNEVGGNVIRQVRSATLIDIQTGEVVFRAVVDTGN
jgi:hypothetical protein